jgi:hypothetical protein
VEEEDLFMFNDTIEGPSDHDGVKVPSRAVTAERENRWIGRGRVLFIGTRFSNLYTEGE